MTAAIYHRKLARVLDRMGGLYSLNDILAAIAAGRMQSFVEGDSWAITQLQDFPHKRKLHIVALVGDLHDIDGLQVKILDYADEVKADLVSADGRRGWAPHAIERGWRLKARSYLYHREP